MTVRINSQVPGKEEIFAPVRPTIELGEDPASKTMGVRFLGCEAGQATYRQDIESWQIDQRRGPTLSALGVLTDAALGSGAYLLALDRKLDFVVSQLSVSMAAWAEPTKSAIATGRACHFEDHTDTVLSTGSITSQAGLIATATCRSIGVLRPRDKSRDSIPPLQATPPKSDSEVTLGHLSLGVPRRESSTPAVFTAPWNPLGWMSNGLGSVQGGVLLCCADAVTHRVIEMSTDQERGRESSLLDLTIDIMRSPRITQSNQKYRWRTTVLRQGKRLSVASSDLSGPDGRLYARATATFVTRDANL